MIRTLLRGRTPATSTLGAIALLATVGSCAKALPPGFSEGTHWAVPIFGALGDGTPLAPVTIDGRGPYLFALDVNQPSAIEPRLVRELGLAQQDPKPGSDADPSVSVPRVTLGNLTVAPARLRVDDVRGTHHGRAVQGTIGRDILHPSLIWTLDRDRQTLYLAVREKQGPPPNAKRVPVKRNQPDDALLVQAAIGEGTTANLRVTFEPFSSLRPAVAEKAALEPGPGGSWVAEEVRVGEVSVSDVLFTAFGAPAATAPEAPAGAAGTPAEAGEAAPPANPAAAPAAGNAQTTPADEGIDGVLGQRFWAQFVLAMHLGENALWLAPRAEDIGALTSERLARWGTLFDGCENAACVTVAVKEPAPPPPPAPEPAPEPPAKASGKPAANGKAAGNGKPAGKLGAKAAKAEPPPPPPPPPSNRLVVTRDPGKKDEVYDLLLQAFDEVDAPLPAPYVLVSLPKGATEVSFDLVSIQPAYERATSFRVVDATPFPPPCREKQGCFWLQR